MGGTLLLYNPDRNQKIFDLARPSWKWGDTNFRSLLGPYAGAEISMETSYADALLQMNSNPNPFPTGAKLNPVERPPQSLFFGDPFGNGGIFDPGTLGDLFPPIQPKDVKDIIGGFTTGGSSSSVNTNSSVTGQPHTAEDWLRAFITGRGETSLYGTFRDIILASLGAVLIIVAIYFLLK